MDPLGMQAPDYLIDWRESLGTNPRRKRSLSLSRAGRRCVSFLVHCRTPGKEAPQHGQGG